MTHTSNELFTPTQLQFLKSGTIFLLGCLINITIPALAATPATENASASTELESGKRIYLEGLLPSGAPLTGTRFGNTSASGASVACVNCHRPSGMGGVEGDIQVPPITGKFLFSTKKDRQLATMDLRVSKFFNQSHDPYTDTALSEAILHGMNNRGTEMSVAMPRYALSEPEMRAITAYLKQLSSQWSPGVTNDNIHFATVITPDVDPARRKAMIAMMRAIVRQKNGSTVNAKQGATRHHMVSAAEMVLGTERTWTLDIWELQGPPDTWGSQLEANYRSNPVFALISGLSNSTWQPVHDFCDHEKVPCWFPSVELPPSSISQYSLYFSRGVSLEADVLARYLSSQTAPPTHLIQIFRDDAVGRAASQQLAQSLAGSSTVVENRALSSNSDISGSLSKALDNINSKDTVMFWLQPDDIALLKSFKPVPGKSYFSAVLSKGEYAPLPAEWKAQAQMVYPYELPEMREANLTYFHIWLNLVKQPIVDEPMQSEVFFAMNFLTDTISEMLDNLYRDYLIERAETMLDRREGSKSEQETRDRMAVGQAGEIERKHGMMTAEKKVRLPLAKPDSMSNKKHGTTIYPHLNLGPGQRFASKGGYIVRFANRNSDKLIADSDWIVP